MKKRELMESLASIDAEEIVFFDLNGAVLSLSSVAVNGSRDGDEPPIFATVMLVDGSDEHKAITTARKAFREQQEEDAKREREIVEARAAKERDDANAAAEAQRQMLKELIAEGVAAALAEMKKD